MWIRCNYARLMKFIDVLFGQPMLPIKRSTRWFGVGPFRDTTWFRASHIDHCRQKVADKLPFNRDRIWPRVDTPPKKNHISSMVSSGWYVKGLRLPDFFVGRGKKTLLQFSSRIVKLRERLRGRRNYYKDDDKQPAAHRVEIGRQVHTCRFSRKKKRAVV